MALPCALMRRGTHDAQYVLQRSLEPTCWPSVEASQTQRRVEPRKHNSGWTSCRQPKLCKLCTRHALAQAAPRQQRCPEHRELTNFSATPELHELITHTVQSPPTKKRLSRGESETLSRAARVKQVPSKWQGHTARPRQDGCHAVPSYKTDKSRRNDSLSAARPGRRGLKSA